MSDQEQALQTREDIQKKVDDWQKKIAKAWSKSIESIVNVAKLLKEADEDIASKEDYENLVTKLPFSPSVASNLRTIANHPVLTDRTYYGKLPGYINTLYYLAFVPQENLTQLIEQKIVDQQTKLAKAKSLAVEYGYTPDTAKVPTLRFEDMVEVGLIAVPKDTDINQFIPALDEFLATYQAASRYTHKEGSLAEKYREMILEKAEEKLKETQHQLGNYTLEQVRMLDQAASYLSVRSNPKEDVAMKNKALKKAGLPRIAENYDALKALLNADVTNENIRQWCKDKQVPCKLMVKSLDKEVYVWELLRTYASDKEDLKVLRLIEQISQEQGNSDAVKQAALEALAIAQKFANPRKSRTESAPRKKRTPRKKAA